MNSGNTGTNPNAAPDGPSTDEEFDAAFDAASGEGDHGASALVDQSGQTDQSADEPPAPADAGATPPPAAPAAPAQANSDDDIWSNADPVYREAFDTFKRDMELRLNGARGRASGQERELQQLRQRLAELEAGSGNAQQTGQAAANDEGGQRATPLSDDSLNRLREDYPEVAGPLLDVIGDLKAQISQLQAPVGALQQQQQVAALTAQEQLLASQHPDWLQAASDDRFRGWLEEQPTSIKEAFARNESAIVDGADAALVIGKFKSDLGFAAPAQQRQAPTNPVQDRRQRQIAAGRDAGRNGPPASTGIAQDDFDAAYDAFAAKAAMR